jgi:hypothetical protein
MNLCENPNCDLAPYPGQTTCRWESCERYAEDRRLSTVPEYRTSCGFTFYFVPDVGWTDGDLTFATFAEMAVN